MNKKQSSSSADHSLHVVGIVNNIKQNPRKDRLSKFLEAQKENFRDEETEVFDGAEDLRRENRRRIQAMLELAKEHTGGVDNGENSREKNDCQQSALEILRRKEWLQNQTDYSELGKSSKSITDTVEQVSENAHYKKVQGDEEYFSGTKRNKPKNKRKNKQEVVISLDELNQMKGTSQLPVQQQDHWRSTMRSSFSSQGGPVPVGLPYVRNCWQEKPGSKLFPSKPQPDPASFNSPGKTEEELLELAIAESLKTHKAEEERFVGKWSLPETEWQHGVDKVNQSSEVFKDNWERTSIPEIGQDRYSYENGIVDVGRNVSLYNNGKSSEDGAQALPRENLGCLEFNSKRYENAYEGFINIPSASVSQLRDKTEFMAQNSRVPDRRNKTDNKIENYKDKLEEVEENWDEDEFTVPSQTEIPKKKNKTGKQIQDSKINENWGHSKMTFSPQIPIPVSKGKNKIGKQMQNSKDKVPEIENWDESEDEHRSCGDDILEDENWEPESECNHKGLKSNAEVELISNAHYGNPNLKYKLPTSVPVRSASHEYYEENTYWKIKQDNERKFTNYMPSEEDFDDKELNARSEKLDKIKSECQDESRPISDSRKNRESEVSAAKVDVDKFCHKNNANLELMTSHLDINSNVHSKAEQNFHHSDEIHRPIVQCEEVYRPTLNSDKADGFTERDLESFTKMQIQNSPVQEKTIEEQADTNGAPSVPQPVFPDGIPRIHSGVMNQDPMALQEQIAKAALHFHMLNSGMYPLPPNINTTVNPGNVPKMPFQMIPQIIPNSKPLGLNSVPNPNNHAVNNASFPNSQEMNTSTLPDNPVINGAQFPNCNAGTINGVPFHNNHGANSAAFSNIMNGIMFPNNPGVNNAMFPVSMPLDPNKSQQPEALSGLNALLFASQSRNSVAPNNLSENPSNSLTQEWITNAVRGPQIPTSISKPPSSTEDSNTIQGPNVTDPHTNMLGLSGGTTSLSNGFGIPMQMQPLQQQTENNIHVPQSAPQWQMGNPFMNPQIPSNISNPTESSNVAGDHSEQTQQAAMLGMCGGTTSLPHGFGIPMQPLNQQTDNNNIQVPQADLQWQMRHALMNPLLRFPWNYNNPLLPPSMLNPFITGPLNPTMMGMNFGNIPTSYQVPDNNSMFTNTADSNVQVPASSPPATIGLGRGQSNSNGISGTSNQVGLPVTGKGRGRLMKEV